MEYIILIIGTIKYHMGRVGRQRLTLRHKYVPDSYRKHKWFYFSVGPVLIFALWFENWYTFFSSSNFWTDDILKDFKQILPAEWIWIWNKLNNKIALAEKFSSTVHIVNILHLMPYCSQYFQVKQQNHKQWNIINISITTPLSEKFSG